VAWGNRIKRNVSLDAEDLEHVKNGEQVDASKYSGYYAWDIANYNKFAGQAEAAADVLRKAEDQLEEQKNATLQSAASWAQATVEAVFQRLENIGNYYQSFKDQDQAMIDSLHASLEYNETLRGYADNQARYFSIYSSEIGHIGNQIQMTRQQIQKEEEELENSVKNGDIVINSEEYREAKNRIQSLKTEYIGL